MMQLVQPKLLGDYEEFQKDYEKKIFEGQYKDATPELQEDAKSTATKLHGLTDEYIHRLGFEVLQPLIPKKQEHVVYIRLTATQQNLYRVSTHTKHLAST